ncbi:MAG TPA: ISL3 family transposase [Acidobacteriaceae bacterium]|nr:ISL3 family transposase [Acidobacteriaceae bacterium]
MSRRLLPLIPAGLSVSQVLPAPDRIIIVAAPTASQSACPLCGAVSSRVHSHYSRSLADLPWQGRTVVLRVRARRFRCVSAGCSRRIFTERLPDVMPPRARRTARLGGIQCHIGLALGGEAGSRLAARLSMPVSGDTLLRLIRAAELERYPPPRVVGIDEWAWRRGQRYGTIICDLERSRPIDLLPERKTEVVADWLKRHSSIEVVVRDRSGSYAEAARLGAPDALQTADRWHLLRNLGDALQGAVDRHRGAVRQAARVVAHGVSPAPADQAPAPYSTKETRLRAERQARRRARYEELYRLSLSGLSAEAIAPVLGMSATAARRWLKAGGPPAHSKPIQLRPLDPYIGMLDRRWREGCRNASRLWRELREQGFTGSRQPVARWVARRRREDPPPEAGEVQRTAAWPAPSSRRCARLLTTATDKLDALERIFLAQLAEIAPDLAYAGELAGRFTALVRNAPDKSSGPALDAWVVSARGTALDAFARGIERDRDAVAAALSEPWSTGPVEGQINRLKLLKRSMYGRANYSLLRSRVLAAA